MIIPVIELGTVSSWVTAGSVGVGVVGMLKLLAKFFPQWIEAKTAERRSDYEIAHQIRDELLSRLNDCESKHEEFRQENEKLNQRIVLLEDGDRRKTIAITLLMNELARLDPTSDIIIRAKGVLELSSSFIAPFDKETRDAIRRLGEHQ